MEEDMADGLCHVNVLCWCLMLEYATFRDGRAALLPCASLVLHSVQRRRRHSCVVPGVRQPSLDYEGGFSVLRKRGESKCAVTFGNFLGLSQSTARPDSSGWQGGSFPPSIIVSCCLPDRITYMNDASISIHSGAAFGLWCCHLGGILWYFLYI